MAIRILPKRITLPTHESHYRKYKVPVAPFSIVIKGKDSLVKWVRADRDIAPILEQLTKTNQQPVSDHERFVRNMNKRFFDPSRDKVGIDENGNFKYFETQSCLNGKL
jgi:hypothetical protein